MRVIREKFKKHAFTLSLKERASSSVILTNEAIAILKNIFPSSTYAEKTWNAYANRLFRWLELCGFVVPSNNGWLYRDQGDVTSERSRLARGRGGELFTAPASPALALEALSWLISKGNSGKDDEKPKGYRNALYVLSRFGLASKDAEMIYPNKMKIDKYSSLEEAIWMGANSEPVLVEIMQIIEKNNEIAGKDIGKFLSDKYSLHWTDASQARNGGAIKQWSSWLIEGKGKSTIPPCPGRLPEVVSGGDEKLDPNQFPLL